MTDSPTGCQCIGPGFCLKMRRQMSTVRHHQCATEEGYYRVFLREAGQMPLPVDSIEFSKGAGSELYQLFKSKGIPSCGNCQDLARKMNAWGVEGCRQRRDEIVEDIFPRAKAWISQNHPWIHNLLPDLVKDPAIRSRIGEYIDEAIARAEANPPEFHC